MGVAFKEEKEMINEKATSHMEKKKFPETDPLLLAS